MEYRRFKIINESQKQAFEELVAEKEISSVKSSAPPIGTIHLVSLSMNEFKSFVTIQGEPFNMALFAEDMVWL